jgi:hypothetical protein
MNSSTDRRTFQLKAYIQRCEEDGKEPLEEYINMYQKEAVLARENEASKEWQKDNLEYDLRSTEWICNKAKSREEYAQNIYAALCNNSFVKNNVWPLLRDQRWSCSWRYAGGIVADMQEKGDYIDWYCSGIRGSVREEDFVDMTAEQIEKHHWMNKYFVGESRVTDEVREDLFKLGWIVVDEDQDN